MAYMQNEPIDEPDCHMQLYRTHTIYVLHSLIYNPTMTYVTYMMHILYVAYFGIYVLYIYLLSRWVDSKLTNYKVSVLGFAEELS